MAGELLLVAKTSLSGGRKFSLESEEVDGAKFESDGGSAGSLSREPRNSFNSFEHPESREEQSCKHNLVRSTLSIIPKFAISHFFLKCRVFGNCTVTPSIAFGRGAGCTILGERFEEGGEDDGIKTFQGRARLSRLGSSSTIAAVDTKSSMSNSSIEVGGELTLSFSSRAEVRSEPELGEFALLAAEE